MESVSVGLWSVLPPLVAIVLALLTKEVIFSLACGIFSGAVIYAVAANLGVAGVFSSVSDLMIEKMGGNAALLLFVVLLGALVAVITKAGGSAAYGSWAAGKLRSGTSAQLATGFLGCLIFIDDYFNCFTVGTVMRPVTDKNKVSREKLAYLIDATAAPVCIIAPISSWAASVISYYPTDGTMTGMQAFLRAIPMNLYAILSIVMVFWLCIRKKGDFGPMAAAQRRAEEQGLQNLMERGEQPSSKGRVLDLVIPIAALIVFSIFSMLYYGGYWNGEGLSLFDAFGATDAGTALAMASLLSLIVAFLLFVPRRLLSFQEFFQGIVSGIQTMVPACVILTLAWTISGVCRDLLATGDYVAGVVAASNMPVMLIPAIMFGVSAMLSFATGTSWGTFGILIPIIVSVCETAAPELTVTALSAILAGSVFGDHCSPISDTTIMSSTGAGCAHIDHVSTQLPYSLTVASVCVAGYLVAGFSAGLGFGTSLLITDVISLLLLAVLLLALPKIWSGEKKAVQKTPSLAAQK